MKFILTLPSMPLACLVQRCLPLPLALSCLVLITGAQASDSIWTEDYAAALKQAKAEKKDLLLDFTGSDWCVWCIRLHKEIFNTETFKQTVPSSFVLVELDYPHHGKQSDELKKQNSELRSKFSPGGFPTVYLLDGDGRAYAQTGYSFGGPQKYVASLETLRGRRAERDSKWAAAARASGGERARLLAEGLQALQNNALVVKFYTEELTEVDQLDPEGKSGGKTICDRMREEIAVVERFRNALNEIINNARTDYPGAVRKLEALAEDKAFSNRDRQQALGIAGDWATDQLHDDNLARDLYTKAISIDPEPSTVEYFEGKLKNIGSTSKK